MCIRDRVSVAQEIRRQTAFRKNFEKQLQRKVNTAFRRFTRSSMFLYRETGIYEPEVARDRLNEELFPVMLSFYRKVFLAMYSINEEYETGDDELYLNVDGKYFEDVSDLLIDAGKGYGFGGVFTDFDNDNDIDFIEKSVAAKKPVLCEKPIDLNIKLVNECADRLKGNTIPIQLGFNRRFDPGHQAAKQSLLDGEIGDLHQCIITSRDPGLPSWEYLQGSGGQLRDMTIHDFDLARYMLGEEPIRVFAISNALIDPKIKTELGDSDTLMIIMETENGKQCHINNSRSATYGYDQRVELFGSKGMTISDNLSLIHISEPTRPY